MAGGDKNIWIVANWKSNKTIAEALEWIGQVGPQIPKAEWLKVVVCPTFSALSEVKKAITVGNFPILVGSQDLSPFGNGAYPPLPDSRETCKRNSEFVWVWYRCDSPSPISALPPLHYILEASPKAISRNTSYFRV